jgi:hypothetical protein
LIEEVQRTAPEAVAICLLFSFVRPQHEKQIAEALEKLQVPLSISHQILPEYREYERTSTVCGQRVFATVNGKLSNALNPIICHQQFSWAKDSKPKDQSTKLSLFFASHAIVRRQHLS